MLLKIDEFVHHPKFEFVPEAGIAVEEHDTLAHHIVQKKQILGGVQNHYVYVVSFQSSAAVHIQVDLYFSSGCDSIAFQQYG